MSESDWPASLSDSELEELDQFLRAHPGEDHLLLDGVHGLLTALAIGPSPATPDEWLPEVLHEPFADVDEGERILTLLARLNDSVTLEIETGAYEPILGEIETDDGSTAFTSRGWCEGFSRGIDLRAAAWEARLGQDSDLMQFLGPIIALSIEDEVFDSDAEFAALSDEEYDECLARIPESIDAVSTYWRDNPVSEDEYVRHGDDDRRPRPPRRRGGRWVH
ncbi:MAG: YecA family protein [Dokdonella sp.]|mgnify:FL=1|uniref:YecA/YgfB family protein n=1 Tax=Dokdonella sp. TaxID=2291710 RepID=UPI002D064FBA|nr:YecA family protein [Xanthomonadales bacterium]HQV71888.1 YecA family protein [Dokdonella sp.]MBK7210312.1 YecA family protein [Xanthomonadales bacterium]MBL0223764.1 YecA family protein [Xanthomonadales bacterium]HQX65645.1 YecA family protein [Dokdonella sp.]